MKFNYKELAELSYGKSDLEGRLNYKKTGGNVPPSGLKERWFKLKLNFLFYYNVSENGRILEDRPAGAMVLENCIAAEEEVADFPFAFSLTFKGEGDRCHLFSGRSRENICRWVTAINCGSYSYWRRKLEVLQTELISVTGKDPLLMLPWNNLSNTKYASPDVRKTQKKTSFRCYLDNSGKQVELDKFHDKSLDFCENHFGNGLEAIGNARLKLGNDNAEDERNHSDRGEPCPPIRPPRQVRPAPAPPVSNLIDL